MAVQFAPPRRVESLGESIGNSVGTGLNTLIERKIHDLNRHAEVQKKKKWLKEANLPDWLGEIEDPKVFEEFIKKFNEASPQEQQSARNQIDQMDKEYHQPDNEDEILPQQLQQPNQTNQPPQQQQPFFGARAPKQPVAPNGAESPMGTQAPAEDMGRPESKISGLTTLMNAGNGDREQQTSDNNVQMEPELGHGNVGAVAPEQSSEPRNRKREWALNGKGRGGQPTSIQQQRLDLAREKEEGVKERFAINRTQKYVDSIYDQEKAKNEEDNVLKRIIHVSEKDDARNPVLSAVMKQIGVDYQGLQNADTLELGKLERWFLRGGVKMFGGRVTNAEMGVLLSSVPSMLQTKEGRIRLANQMLLANKDFHDEYKALDEILEEHGDVRPANIRTLVERRMGPLREKNAEQFIKGIEEIQKSAFKVGQQVDDLSRVPNGTEVTENGKLFVVQNGKAVPKG